MYLIDIDSSECNLMKYINFSDYEFTDPAY